MHGRSGSPHTSTDVGAWTCWSEVRDCVDALPCALLLPIAVNESVSGGVPKPIRRDPTNGAVLGETSVLLFLGEDSLGVHADARASDHCPALTHYRDNSDLFLQERDAARREGRSVILSAVGSAPHVVGRW